LLYSIETMRHRLTCGATTSRALVEYALSRAGASDGEGRLVFTSLDPSRVRAAADGVDALRTAGVDLSPIAGIPVSVKDLFDVKGEVTTAGSAVLRGSEPVAADAPVIARLKRAGAILVGRTNMTEFAFSGVGLNPHYGTPANPYYRPQRLIPGGSSSGAAVSVSDGMALAGICTDTGGSARIPAALCGLTGFKPTQSRVPLEGVFPLSPTLDSVGVIAPTVGCCAAVDAMMAGEAWRNLQRSSLSSKLIGVPKHLFCENLDPHVAKSFDTAVSVLSRAGARISDVALPELCHIATINSKGGFAAAESYAYHRRLAAPFDAYDPLVRERILRGKDLSAGDYLDMLHTRALLIRAFDRAHAELDFILCPTVPLVAPEARALQESAEEFRRVNLLLLRNPSVANLLDRCALSVPCHCRGEAPVGLMLMGRRLEDRKLLSFGAAVEQALSCCCR
jgi:aspartyl-tRNA(Asn)/glutamyl-tRNA(Gln) amidotransferase subunit A